MVDVRRGGRWAILLIGMGLAGCAEELGPEVMETVEVSGKVRSGGRPIGRGWLEFMPVGGTLGVLRSSALGADGSFRQDRMPVGKVAIRISGLRPGDLGDPRHEQLYHRQLWQVDRIPRTIPGRGPFRLDLDLAAEFDRVMRPAAE